MGVNSVALELKDIPFKFTKKKSLRTFSRNFACNTDMYVCLSRFVVGPHQTQTYAYRRPVEGKK